MTQHSQNGEGVEVSARVKMIGGLIDRLEERRQIRWNAPDKDGVIHQLVDRQYLIDAIICLDAYRQSLAREPATADVGRDREIFEAGWEARELKETGPSAAPSAPATEAGEEE